jgi:hypothetical protein
MLGSHWDRAQMATKPNWMIYGANGFTARLIAREAKHKNLRPILAGRRAEPIRELAAQLEMPWRSFDVNDPSAVAAALTDVGLVLNCAGPFSATSGPMLDACLAGRTHYLDITGEIDVFVAAQARDEDAKAADIVICPGVGFDVVPTDCLAAVLKQMLPNATYLALGFDVNGTPSPGTAKTMVEALGTGGRVRRNGEIAAVPFAYRTRLIDFGRGEALGVTIPWGDVATAYYSTGIPDIEVYLRSASAAVFGMRCLNFLGPGAEGDGAAVAALGGNPPGTIGGSAPPGNELPLGRGTQWRGRDPHGPADDAERLPPDRRRRAHGGANSAGASAAGRLLHPEPADGRALDRAPAGHQRHSGRINPKDRRWDRNIGPPGASSTASLPP